MKQKFIVDFQLNDKLQNEEFAIKQFKFGKTHDGRDYVDVLLSDKTGEIQGKIWQDEIASCETVKPGDIVRLSGHVGEFKDKQQLKISFLQKIEDFNLPDFLPTTEKDPEEMWTRVKAYMDKIEDADIAKLINNIFSDDFINDYKKAPAAEKIHHAYLGGLMEHTLEMLDLSAVICEHYQDLDKSLLIGGIILHDIGKLQELHVDHTIYRTTAGSLAGHISLGAMMVDKEIQKIKNFPKEKKVKLLNIVLSHHEKLEFGSPVKPMTAEAFAVAYIDNLSAKVNTADQVVKNYSSGDHEYSDRIFALDTKLYLN